VLHDPAREAERAAYSFFMGGSFGHLLDLRGVARFTPGGRMVADAVLPAVG
jgi:hypothetical protein